jgi:anti-sigma factor RsiW
MNDPVYNQLRDLSWRRELTPAEHARLQAWLAAHPEAKEDWEAEASLNHLLQELPQAPPVSSNFTALVLQAVERDSAATACARQSCWRVWWQSWWPRTAVATTVLALGIGVFLHQRQVEQDRFAMARSVTDVYPVVEASNPDVMENFDAIAWLGDLQPKGDSELLALME